MHNRQADQKSLANVGSRLKQKRHKLTTKLLITVARKLTKEVCDAWKWFLQVWHHTRRGFGDRSRWGAADRLLTTSAGYL